MATEAGTPVTGISPSGDEPHKKTAEELQREILALDFKDDAAKIAWVAAILSDTPTRFALLVDLVIRTLSTDHTKPQPPFMDILRHSSVAAAWHSVRSTADPKALPRPLTLTDRDKYLSSITTTLEATPDFDIVIALYIYRGSKNFDFAQDALQKLINTWADKSPADRQTAYKAITHHCPLPAFTELFERASKDPATALTSAQQLVRTLRQRTIMCLGLLALHFKFFTKGNTRLKQLAAEHAADQAALSPST